MALATYDEIKDAVETIQGDDQSFKPLVLALGGAHWIATTIRGTMTALPSLGWDAMENVVETALSVPPWLVAKLKAFVRLLFDLLRDGIAVAEEVLGETQDAVAQGTQSMAKFGVMTARRVFQVAKTGARRAVGDAKNTTTHSKKLMRQTVRKGRTLLHRKVAMTRRAARA